MIEDVERTIVRIRFLKNDLRGNVLERLSLEKLPYEVICKGPWSIYIVTRFGESVFRAHPWILQSGLVQTLWVKPIIRVSGWQNTLRALEFLPRRMQLGMLRLVQILFRQMRVSFPDTDVSQRTEEMVDDSDFPPAGPLLQELRLSAEDAAELEEFFETQPVAPSDRAIVDEQFRLRRLYAGKVVILEETAAGTAFVMAGEVGDPELSLLCEKIRNQDAGTERYRLQAVFPSRLRSSGV